jgi:hypothetical protein
MGSCGQDGTGAASRDGRPARGKEGTMTSESNDPAGREPVPGPPAEPARSGEMPERRPAAGTPTGFDAAAVPRSVWISLGGGVVLLLSVFFSWYTLTVSIAGRSGSKSESGWDSGSAAKIIALLAIVIIAAWLVELFADRVTLPFPAWMVAGAAGAVSVVLVIVKIVSKPAGDEIGKFNALGFGHASVGTSWGIWVALLSSIAVVAGAYMCMNERA